MANDQITWGEWAQACEQIKQDQLREQQKLFQQTHTLTLAELPSCTHTVTNSQNWVTGTVAHANAGYEHRGGKPEDAKTPTKAVDFTVNGTVTVPIRTRSLMDALARMDASWRSDGRPHRFEVE